MDQLILLPSVLLHKDNRLVQDDLAALSWPGCTSTNNRRGGPPSRNSYGGSSFCGTRVTFTGNGTFYVCVKNDGMSDQQPKQNFQANNRGNSSGVAAATGGAGGYGGPSGSNGANDNRPGSARSNRERHERVILLKERQNSERIKKLEELKEQALAAARLREEQDSKRRKHFEELGRRDEERRRQAEERRRMLEEERRVTLQAKWETKKQNIMSASICSASGAVGGGGSSRTTPNKPTYAFGSCTPRLLDNHVDGFLWKSQYNLNITKEPGMRASSAHDLHLQQKEVRMSTSMYEWNQHRTTPDNPLVHSSKNGQKRSSNRHRNEGMDTPTRMFCGRRKTDLTPTIPIKRDDYSVMSRSTSRGSGRVYSSMTRLDRSRSPGGTLTQYQHHGSSNLHQSPQRPSRSKSTTHLQSAGLKMTRTEILRQALAAKKESSGIRSVDASRPPSSMSSSIMSSSTHSQVQMRPRTSYVRKARPASVHVTGVTNNGDNGSEASSTPTKENTPLSSRRSETPQSAKSNVSRKPSNELHRRPTTASSQHASTTSGKSSGKTSPSPQQLLMTQSMVETSTMKRPIKKKVSPSVSNNTSTPKLEGAVAPVPAERKKVPTETASSVSSNNNEAAGGTKTKTPEPSATSVPAATTEQATTAGDKAQEEPSQVDKPKTKEEVLNKDIFEINQKEEPQEEKVEVSSAINNKIDASNNAKNNINNFESIESAFASGSEDFTYSSKTPEPFAPSPSVDSTSNTVSELLESAGRDSAATNATLEDGNAQQEWNNPFITNTTPEPTKENLLKPEEVAGAVTVENKGVSPAPGEESNKEESDMESSKPKIMTEAEAKAAIAEKRRLAREAAEREAARIAELERLELERQRLEEEEADRMAAEARRVEEERLRKAIEEEQQRQEEERKRKEEEEKARIEKERQERAAAKEAERIRIEMEERLRREEAERLERKRRVEAIMSRTRKKEAEQQQAKTNNSNSNSAEMLSKQNDLNGHKDNIINQENILQSSVNSLNNNFNNNNDFSGTSNNDLIDNNSTSAPSVSTNNTLISFEGMGNSSPVTTTGQLIVDNAVDLLNFSQQQQNQQQTDGNISPDLLGSTTNSASSTTPALVNVGNNSLSPNNSIINNSQQLQDLLS